MAEKVDARNLWVPVTAAIGALAIAFGAGIAYDRLQSRTSSASQEIVALTGKIDTLRSTIDEMRGSLDTLSQMQSDVSDTKADVRSIQDRLNSFDLKVQTMDAWIQRTRDELWDAGFEPPPYPLEEE